MKIKNLLALLIIGGFFGVLIVIFTFFVMNAKLPQLVTVNDYKPLVVSEMFARDGTKIGEFSRERRIVIPYSEMPKRLVQAFISAEDSTFFQHGGINFRAILRAAFADLRAGKSVQGGSTITQQVAKSLMLSSEKKISRKIKEVLLAYKMEKNLKKEDILYLYLNQILLGNAWGVEAASQSFFRKHVKDLTTAECAILAGLPQAPSVYSPVKNPAKAKERQLYVLGRMAEEGYITKDEMKQAAAEPVKIYYKEEFEDLAPFFKETVRQFLVQDVGEEKLLNDGIRIYTSLDVKKQQAAQKATDKNLRDLDKRQGFRGAKDNLSSADDIADFLAKERDELTKEKLPYRILYPEGKEPPKQPLDLTHKPGTPNLPDYVSVGQIVEGVVTKINSKQGLVTVRFAEAQGLIDLDDMTWARKADTNVLWSNDQVRDPAKVLKVGDVIDVKIKAEKFSSKRLDGMFKKKDKKGKLQPPPADLPKFDDYIALSLEQEPIVQSALLSFDLDNGDVLAMVGGSNYNNNEYNRALQAKRQTGSAFKAIIYAAAMEKGFTPASVIMDAPIVYEEGEGQETKKWKPGNFENKFSGDVLFRTAIIKSLNIPTVKILEKIGLDWVQKYARRLGIFSPLNLDYTMALGSSDISLYELTKAFAVYGKGGKRLHPIIIRKVTDSSGQNTLAENISIDEKFKAKLDQLEVEFHPELAEKLGVTPSATAAQKNSGVISAANAAEAKPGASPVSAAEQTPYSLGQVFNFQDPEQLISPQSAYLITHLLKGVILEGTGARARVLNRPAAGKTGTTNGYSDAWFVGYTPHVATGVWVGFDDPKKSLGRLETGNAAALPIWTDYMQVAVEGYPPSDFPVPQGIVFANIDADTGKLASAKSHKAVREAFREGTEPNESTGEAAPTEEKNFFKEDLSN